jgi:hypothetical protein
MSVRRGIKVVLSSGTAGLLSRTRPLRREVLLRPRAKSNADANEPTRSSAKPAAAEAMRRILIENARRKMHCKGNPSARGPLARFQRSINKSGWICPSFSAGN